MVIVVNILPKYLIISLPISPLYVTGQDMNVAGMPDEKVLSSIIEPLSHPVRLVILKGLFGCSMSYTELSVLTGYKGGHLLFHIARLIEAGLAVKSESTGLYTLTEKGTGVMTLSGNLYCS